MSRERLDLTGPWRFQPDPRGHGDRLGYAGVGCDISRWREVTVPCSFDQCLPGMEFCEGGG